MKVWYWPGNPGDDATPDYPPIDMSALAFGDGQFIAPESGFYTFADGWSESLLCWMRKGVWTQFEFPEAASAP